MFKVNGGLMLFSLGKLCVESKFYIYKDGANTAGDSSAYVTGLRSDVRVQIFL